MRLKLTLEYDGTAFRGWARQPGERTVEGELRAALEQRLRVVRRARRRRPHRHRRARARERRLGRRRAAGRRPSGPPRRSTRVLPDDVAVVAAEEAAPRLPRALLGPLALVPLPDLAPARALAVRGAPLALAPAPARPRAPRTRRAALLLGEHDFRAFTPTDTQHEVFVRVVESAALARPRRRRRVRDHRRLVPAPHGADARRHDARARARPSSPSCSKGAPRTAAGSTAPPWGLYLAHVGY